MDTILRLLGGSLGVVVPVVFVLALRVGIRNAPFTAAQKSTYWNRLVAAVGIWTAAVWAGSLTGLFSYHPGETVPRFVIVLFAPTLLGWALMMNKTFRTILDHTPLSVLVGSQAFRLMGSALFLVVYAGVLPGAFITGGIGDVATGTLAIVGARLLANRAAAGNLVFWGFTLAGLLDLLNVLFMLLAFYPLWNSGAVTSAPVGDFGLVMLPAIAAPVALVLHGYAVRNFFAVKS